MTTPSTPERGQISASISTALVRMHAQSYGRGPTKARTFLTDSYALCLLEDVFTTAERTLIAAGHAAEVRDTRTTFQDTMRDEFVRVVEEATGRRVRAFMSQIHIDPEMSAELFVFHPTEFEGEESEARDAGT